MRLCSGWPRQLLAAGHLFCVPWLILLPVIPSPLLIPSPGARRGLGSPASWGPAQVGRAALAEGARRASCCVATAAARKPPKAQPLAGAGSPNSARLALRGSSRVRDGCGNRVCHARGAPSAACQEVGYALELMVLEGKREKTDGEFLCRRLKEFSSVKLRRPALRKGLQSLLIQERP